MPRWNNACPPYHERSHMSNQGLAPYSRGHLFHPLCSGWIRHTSIFKMIYFSEIACRSRKWSMNLPHMWGMASTSTTSTTSTFLLILQELLRALRMMKRVQSSAPNESKVTAEKLRALCEILCVFYADLSGGRFFKVGLSESWLKSSQFSTCGRKVWKSCGHDPFGDLLSTLSFWLVRVRDTVEDWALRPRNWYWNITPLFNCFILLLHVENEKWYIGCIWSIEKPLLHTCFVLGLTQGFFRCPRRAAQPFAGTGTAPDVEVIGSLHALYRAAVSSSGCILTLYSHVVMADDNEWSWFNITQPVENYRKMRGVWMQALSSHLLMQRLSLRTVISVPVFQTYHAIH